MSQTLLSIPGAKGGDIIDNQDGSDTQVGSYTWTAAAMDDGDGTGGSHGDPDYQKTTSLRYAGASLNADEDIYVVVPEQFPRMIGPVVLGCQARVTNLTTGQSTDAVVGDLGPRGKLGEYSTACDAAIGVPASPTTGGTDAHIIQTTIWPGQPAKVNGKAYALQPA